MRTMIDGVALLAGIMGIAAGAAAGENDAGVAGKRVLYYFCSFVRLIQKT